MREHAEPRRSKPACPRVFLRDSIIALSAALLLGSPTRLTAQSAPGKLEFEAAAIHQSKPNEASHTTFSLDNGNVYSTVKDDDVLGPTGGYFAATNVPLLRYIIFAYNLTGTQELALRFGQSFGLSSNAPDWISSKFDIQARADGHPTKDQVRQMMRSLLEDRFKLAVHTESRQAPVFALVLVNPGKTGPHLQPHPADDSCSAPSSTEPPSSSAPNPPPHPAARAALPIACGVIAHLPPSAPGNLHFGGRDIPLGLLASSLPTQTGMATLPRPVIDQTGLSGTFDLSLEWLPENDGTPGQGDEAGTTFRTALKNQLGLKLVPQKAPVDILVIDHAEHPSNN
jgi:uncharacterized protein (TIGR03435 family)